MRQRQAKKMQQLVLASSNEGKLNEINAIFAEIDIEVLPQSQFNIPDVEETGTTFVENAILKAKHSADISGLPALADDSGLVVPALGGAPGIYSARYAQKTPDEPKDDTRNNEKLLHAMANIDNRDAAFVCVMALCLSGSHPLPLIAEGIWRGEIAREPFGEGGFGYDPLFYVPTHQMTAAEMNKAEKNRVSHRGMALRELLSTLKLNQ